MLMPASHTCIEIVSMRGLQVSEAIREGAEGFFSTQVHPHLSSMCRASGWRQGIGSTAFPVEEGAQPDVLA